MDTRIFKYIFIFAIGFIVGSVLFNIPIIMQKTYTYRVLKDYEETHLEVVNEN